MRGISFPPGVYSGDVARGRQLCVFRRRMATAAGGLVTIRRKSRRRKRDDANFSVAFHFNCWSVGTEKLPSPPNALRVFFDFRGKPILPNDGANLFWRRVWKWIARKESEDVRIICEQPSFSARHDGRCIPRTERSKP